MSDQLLAAYSFFHELSKMKLVALFEGRSSQARQLPKERERVVHIFGAKVRKILLHKSISEKIYFLLKNASRVAHSLSR